MTKASPVKILQLRECSGFYGAENVIVELAKELQKKEYEVILGLLPPHQSNIDLFIAAARKNGIAIKIFQCHRMIDVQVICAIRRFVKQSDIALIQSHGYKSNFYALMASRFMKIPLIATCHPWAENKYSVVARIYEKLDLSWLNLFDRIVTISEDVKRKILEKGITKQKVCIIENGIDLSRFNRRIDRNEIRRKFGIPGNSVVVGTVGRLSIEKGHAILIEVAKDLKREYPNLHLIIIGDGPLKQNLQQKAGRFNLNRNVHFLGITDDIPGVLALMDLFVLPSLGEGLPMTLLEAMAAKVAVIATKVGDIPKVITHEYDGLLIPANDREAMKNAILFLLNNKKKREAIAKKGYLRVSQNFSSQKMAKKYTAIYQSCHV